LAFILAVTNDGSSVGTGVAEGIRTPTVVDVGDSLSSASVVGILCNVGSSLAVVGEGSGED
jgi:hypothetical protein